MRFHLSEQQDQFQASLRGVLKDHADAPRRALESDGIWSDGLWADLMGLGVGGVLIPTDHGGSGLAMIDAALALETMGEHAGPGAFMAQILAGAAIASGLQSDLTSEWLTGIATGDTVAVLALATPWNDGVQPLTQNAGQLTGQTGRVLAGPNVDLLIVSLPDGDLGVVRVASEGVSVIPVAGSDPTRPLSCFVFDKAPFTALQTATGAGARLTDATSVLLAADALGGAERCLALAVDYAKTRRQFGRPIGVFQAMKHQLAGMALEVEPARGLVWYAAHAWDTQSPDAARVACLAKAHLADRFMSVARAAVEAHGGIGYTWEHDLHIWFRRALFDTAYGGSPAWHRERAAQLVGW